MGYLRRSSILQGCSWGVKKGGLYMLYKNKVTGEVIEVNAKISGGNWEPVKAPKKAEEKAPAEEKKGTKKK